MTIRSIDRTVTTETPFYVLTKMEYDLKLRRVANRRQKPGSFGVYQKLGLKFPKN